MAAIPGDSPTGSWLRYEGSYARIVRARREDDASLPTGVWKRELQKMDVEKVVRLCTESLETGSKDLQIAVWLADAWIRSDGLLGFSWGADLIAGLCRNFWDDLFPEAEEEDLEARSAPLEWFNDRASLQLKYTPITASPKPDEPPFHLIDWESSAHRVETTGEKEADGHHARAEILAVAALTPSETYRRLIDELATAGTSLEALNEALRDCFADEAPSLLNFSETFEAIEHFARRALGDRPEMTKEESTADADRDQPSSTTPASKVADEEQAVIGSPIKSRAEAYRMLEQASEYLMATEPHSPTPYLVRRAVSWGRMTLTELLTELLNQSADLNTVSSLLGIRLDQTGLGDGALEEQ